MIAEDFYDRVTEAFTRPPVERHGLMVELHAQVMREYVAAVEKISEHDAQQPISIGSDDRTLAQIVAHIAEWERFGILAASDILVGLNHPRTVTDVRGYVDTNGQRIDFAGVDEFNAHQKQKYASWPWPQLQNDAITYAKTLYSLFAHPHLLTATKLDQTQPHHIKLGNGQVIENITMGWSLWVIYLDHEAIEHAKELNLGSG